MKKYVLVINCGSSSLKFAVLDAKTGDTPFHGIAEKLNQEQGFIKVKTDAKTYEQHLVPNGHFHALEVIVHFLKTEDLIDKIQSVGHRIVHGGEYFSESVLITDDVRNKIEECARLAPLHNPAHVIGIDAAKSVFPSLPQVAVFDTAFHQKMPEKAYLYALPMKFYRDFHIRKYGFHGTSYRFIASEIGQETGKDSFKAIVCHLGNGGSVAAINTDHSLDTTMGLTPLEGIVHGTRTGDIDPAIPALLVEQFGFDIKDVNNILWKESGLLGLSELSNDARTLEEEKDNGNENAIRALEVYCYRLAKHIASQMVALNGADMIVFTGGIGENSSFMRKKTIDYLGYLGFHIDNAKNEATIRGKKGVISTDNSLPIYVIPTNEELLIAKDATQILTNLAGA